MDQVTYIKLKQSTTSVAARIVGLVGFLLLFWWAKAKLFNWAGDLTGWNVFYEIASMGFLFWISVVVFGVMVAGILVKWYSITYEVFTDRIAISTGVLSKHKRVVNISDFSQLQVERGFIGQLLGYGSIEFMYRTIGPTGGFGENFYNIQDPQGVGEQLRSLMKMADETGETSASTTPKPKTELQHKEDAETLAVAAQAAEQQSEEAVEQVDAAAEMDEISAENVAEDDYSDESANDLSGEIRF